MIVNIYGYRDVQVGAFQKPFYDLSEPKIFRTIIARMVAGMSAEELAKSHVKDLELYSLGQFDDESGLIVSKPVFLVRLSDYIKEASEDGKEIEK